MLVIHGYLSKSLIYESKTKKNLLDNFSVLGLTRKQILHDSLKNSKLASLNQESKHPKEINFDVRLKSIV